MDPFQNKYPPCLHREKKPVDVGKFRTLALYRDDYLLKMLNCIQINSMLNDSFDNISPTSRTS